MVFLPYDREPGRFPGPILWIGRRETDIYTRTDGRIQLLHSVESLFLNHFLKKHIRKISQENFSEEILRKKSLRKKYENHEISMNFNDFTHFFTKKCSLFTFSEKMFFVLPRSYKGF